MSCTIYWLDWYPVTKIWIIGAMVSTVSCAHNKKSFIHSCNQLLFIYEKRLIYMVYDYKINLGTRIYIYQINHRFVSLPIGLSSNKGGFTNGKSLSYLMQALHVNIFTVCVSIYRWKVQLHCYNNIYVYLYGSAILLSLFSSRLFVFICKNEVNPLLACLTVFFCVYRKIPTE